MRTIKNPMRAIEYMKEGKSFNLKLSNGTFIYYVGGILSKLQGRKHYIRTKDKWVEV